MNSTFANSKTGYSSLIVVLHWLMLLMIVATYAMMNLKGMYPRGSHAREVMATWHYLLGMTVFALIWVRLVARTQGVTPEVNPPLPALQITLSKFVHWAIYALMIFLPVLGWLTVSAKGGVIPFWGLELPALVDKNKEMAMLFKNIHGSLATLGYFLVGLHAAAALFHHFFKRDNTLSLMIPSLRKRTY